MKFLATIGLALFFSCTARAKELRVWSTGGEKQTKEEAYGEAEIKRLKPDTTTIWPQTDDNENRVELEELLDATSLTNDKAESSPARPGCPFSRQVAHSWS